MHDTFIRATDSNSSSENSDLHCTCHKNFFLKVSSNYYVQIPFIVPCKLVTNITSDKHDHPIYLQDQKLTLFLRRLQTERVPSPLHKNKRSQNVITLLHENQVTIRYKKQ